MARYVKISTIGCAYGKVDEKASLEEAVVQMTNYLRRKISFVLHDRPDLIVLTEMCDIPENYGQELMKSFIRERGDTILDALREIAVQNSCYSTYPRIKIEADGTWRNTIELIGRDGEVVGHYNKNHPTIGEMEGTRILCGNDAVVLETDFGRVGFVICFDLNFDQLRLKYAAMKPDLLVFSSMYHGGLMQQYWAYSCRSYLVSAIGHSRPSQIVNPVGHSVRTNTNYFDYITESVNLDFGVFHLVNWGKLDQIKEKYGEQARIFDPGNLGAVLLTSETDAFTVKDLIKEFELEPIDDYFVRVLDCQSKPQNRE